MIDAQFHHNEDAEIFIGIVAQLGVDRNKVVKAVKGILSSFKYQGREIRMSQKIRSFDKWKSLPKATKAGSYDYYDQYMKAGDELREIFRDGDALAALSVLEVQKMRAEHYQKEGTNPEISKPIPRTAYIFNSLKHPDEVRYLRRIYGSNFILISIYSPREKRVEFLSSEIAGSSRGVRAELYKLNAEELLNRDEIEDDQFGQNVRETFAQSDFFINSQYKDDLERSLLRFFDLLFRYPYHTPTIEEFSMFQAKAAALRSSALPRQVGAAICNKDGSIISVGCNEVPKAGGGLYWFGDKNDARDFQVENEIFVKRKYNLLDEFVDFILTAEEMKDYLKFKLDKEQITPLTDRFKKKYKETELYNQISLDRTVHAEMAALLDASRKTISVDDCTLYSTTFPCHNCTKHIIASGIRKVVFIEPYPKSLSKELHNDAIIIDGALPQEGKILFQAFMGIAPSMYLKLFSFGKDEREVDGKIIEFDRSKATFSFDSPVYLTNESGWSKLMLERLRESGLMNDSS